MPAAQLTDRAILRIAGPDAHAFLQNVLTLDMETVDRRGSGYGALLTPQGKILWDFILHTQPDGYAADLRAGEVAAFAKRLALYRLRAKAEIAPAPDLAVHAEWRAGSGRPPDPRLAALGSRWLAPVGSLADKVSEADYHRHRIALAIPEGGVDFAFGDTFPHDAAMDSLHGVAFDKGCYIGQEVVSRMRHRGTARRRVVALSADSALPDSGAEVLADGRSVGRLGSSAEAEGSGFLAIAVARLDRLREALAAGAPVLAGSVPVAASLPSWATYTWPAGPAEGD